MSRDFHTTLDKRMFDFEAFYKLVARRMPDDAVMAEVGIANGASVIFLSETMLNKSKQHKIWAIDSLAYGGPDQLLEVIKNITAASVQNFVHILPVDSLNASCRFPDNHFDFVFIDASHRYEETKADIRCWYPKLKDGGFLAGHDYNDDEGKDVKRAVNEVIREEILNTRETAKGYGVWFVKKDWQHPL